MRINLIILIMLLSACGSNDNNSITDEHSINTTIDNKFDFKNHKIINTSLESLQSIINQHSTLFLKLSLNKPDSQTVYFGKVTPYSQLSSLIIHTPLNNNVILYELYNAEGFHQTGLLTL